MNTCFEATTRMTVWQSWAFTAMMDHHWNQPANHRTEHPNSSFFFFFFTIVFFRPSQNGDEIFFQKVLFCIYVIFSRVLQKNVKPIWKRGKSSNSFPTRHDSYSSARNQVECLGRTTLFFPSWNFFSFLQKYICSRRTEGANGCLGCMSGSWRNPEAAPIFLLASTDEQGKKCHQHGIFRFHLLLEAHTLYQMDGTHDASSGLLTAFKLHETIVMSRSRD